ncbi:MAG: 30S ribosomal protein S12 methylthiotransferase RimO [Fervidobacterium sp.]|nr:30S ribosomal protein S12 methylthiotransferase RimO [Fervidobacterium sp.]
MKLYIVVLGCPKNEADFSLVKYHLKSIGYEIVDDLDEADGVVIDTCGFIIDAKQESIDTILEFVERKKRKPGFKVFVTGCLVQRYPKELPLEIPEVDGWFGVIPPKLLAERLEKTKKYITDPIAIYDFEGREDDEIPYAYVKIADGCDRACTFCTIPKFKGGFVSRKIEDIESEVRYLISNGKKEVVLVAQDTTGYGVDIYGKQMLPELLNRLSNLEGNFWIRVMYMHPDHVTDEIIEGFAPKKVLKYFDIPVQHGSDKILKLMGRNKGTRELEELFDKIRQLYPEAVLRTSIIVGFPGEKKEDFEQLLEFIRSVEFDKLGAFVYSDEEDAASYNLPDKVSLKVAQKRLDTLMEVQAEISFMRNQRLVGKIIDVLIEEEANGVLIGRGYMDAPEIDGNVFAKGNGTNRFVKVKVTEADTYDLEGEIVE